MTSRLHLGDDLLFGKTIASAGLLKQILNVSLDGVLVLDSSFKILFWSEVLEKLTGLSTSEAIGNHFFDGFPFLRHREEEKLLHSALFGEPTYSRAHHFVNSIASRSTYLDFNYFPLYGEDKSDALGIIGIVRDKGLEDNTSVMIKMSGCDSLWTYFNQAWLKFRGRSYDEEVGIGWNEGIHPADIQRYRQTSIENFNNRSSFSIEYRVKRTDGVYRWLQDKVEPRYSSTGSFEGFVATSFDVTDYIDSQNKLADAVRIREDFMSFASHELKSPLTSLNLQMNLLQDRDDLDSGIEILKVGERQLSKINELVENLLDFSRFSTGHLSFDIKKFDLSEMLEQICERFNLTSVAAGCMLQKQIEPGIFISGDPCRIDQVVTNLLSNAAKYGAGKPVSITLSKLNLEAEIKVSDQGIGIAKEFQDKLFDKFVRCAPEKFGGLGLGLYITKKIVDGHQGVIGVHSEPEKGSEFFVRLPIA